MVASLIAFERNTYFLARGLDQIQSRYFPDYQGTAIFHAASLRAPAGRVPEPFAQLSQQDRYNIIDDVYSIISDSHAKIIAVAMDKSLIAGDPYERGFEEIVSRFDLFLRRILRDRGEDQRGLIVVAESSYRENLELLAQRIATEGHRWGDIHNLADIPYFAPAKSTRLLQLADFVSNAVYARYESGYTRYFDKIAPNFDQESGRLHGLVHMAREPHSCYCPACLQRRTYGRQETDSPRPLGVNQL